MMAKKRSRATCGVLAALLMGCAAGAGDAQGGPGLGGADDASGGIGAFDTGAESADDSGTAGTSATGGDGMGENEPSCGEAGQPACDCTAIDASGELLLGPCHPGCTDTHWRWSLWTTNYNVAGTLGYGEHQGNGLIGYAYRYDPRFGPADGLDPPWRGAGGALWAMGDGNDEPAQFRMRTINPGAETYVAPQVMPADEDDLWPSETLPWVPESQAHPRVDAAALCELPERLIDVRHFNHGRTLAETVPNHAWDGFFASRGLIPLALLEVIELTRTAAGEWSSPTLPAAQGMPEAVAACLAVVDDGFCDSRCGNCSYVMPTGFIGTPFAASEPGFQIAGVPAASVAPYTVSDAGLVAARTNWSEAEDGHTVWYVGGSVWGRAQDVASYADHGDWPDPDGVPAEAPGDAWMSTAGADVQGNDGIPDDWTDPFTHCVDPSDFAGSQRPASWPRFISGRWGHNSNSDAEASLRQWLGCAQDPVAAVTDAWTSAFACDACGTPRVGPGGEPTQQPCRDHTHTATSYWERSPGTHDVDDFDPGKHDAVEQPRMPTDSWAELPKPVCRSSGEPVYGM